MNYRSKLRVIMMESILTYSGMLICIPVMTVFWNSIGMDQGLIGVSQMICAATLFLFDVPMGYVADRFSRKALNVIGDVGIALTFVFYTFAQSFWMAVVGEILCGLFLAMSGGVDRALLKIYADKIDPDGELFKKKTAQLAVWQVVCMCVAILIGMWIAQYSVRLTLLLSAVPFLVAAVLAMTIKDIGERIEARHTNQFKDMFENFKYLLQNNEVKWLVCAYAIGMEVTHPIIWALTPLFLAGGIPVGLVGFGWILWYGLAPLGALLAKKTLHWKASSQMLVPFAIVLLASLPVILHQNLTSTLFLTLSGISFGIANIYIMPKIQAKVEEKYQTTIVSIAATAARLIYMPIVLITNYLGNIAPQYILLSTLVIFAPLTLLSWVKLRGFERQV